MSVFRKTVLATAIVGAGLASTTGAAFATTSSHGGGCSNDILAKSSNSSGRSLGDTTGGDQTYSASNTCDLLNGNTVDSDGNTATTGGTITNGDTTDERSTSTRTSDTTDTTTIDGG